MAGVGQGSFSSDIRIREYTQMSFMMKIMRNGTEKRENMKDRGKKIRLKEMESKGEENAK